jgi:dienelactone hydrolase
VSRRTDLTRRPEAARVAVLTVVAVVVGACSSARSSRGALDTAPCTQPAPARTHADPGAGPGAVEVDVVLVDRGRATPPTAVRRRQPCRVLPTQIRLPASTAPAPTIVMAHGLDGDPGALRDLADVWTRAGYVVVAPKFPTTVKDPSGRSAASETPLQAGDLRFVLGRVLAGDHTSTSPWFGRVDPAHVGAAGMSLGGLAVYASTIESCCTDPRIDAAVLMAAVYRDVPDSRQHANRIPMMLLQGDVDPGYHNSRDAYSDLRAPKWFVTLHGSRHAPPFEVPRGPEGAVVDATTVAFWDRTLRDDPTGTARIAAAVAAHRATTTLQADPGP